MGIILRLLAGVRYINKFRFDGFLFLRNGG